MSYSVDSAAVQKILQLQVLRATSSSCLQFPSKEGLGVGSTSCLLSPQVKRCSHDNDILYGCAIALKLAPVLQLPAIDIAKQLVTTLGEQFYCRALGIYLNFQVEVVSSGWIYFRLKEESLASWLQRLISLGDRRIKRHGDTETRRHGDAEVGRWEADDLFPMQYAHARCCSLLRLAHRQGIIDWRLDIINSNSPKTDKNPNSQFPIPNSQFPIPNSQFSILNSQFSILLVHPAERRLIAQIVDVQDALSNQGQLQGVKLARELSKAFEQFYRSCRIWGEVKSQAPQLAQARLGLVAVTQVLLRSLLQEKLGILAPVEL
ncbi:MAG: hypothetical protein F6K41_27160 [Symploca sp. SIO3E6]|nr:hypothetical protein [Caldora sp. SIO3E6]